MKLRIATFNVENLFRRPKVMNFASWSEGQPYLDDYAKLTNLLNRETYSAQDKKAILKLLNKHKLTAARPSHRYFELRSLRGRLLERPKGKPPRVVANGRGDWLGWLELKNEAIADPAIVNTARVIAEVNADIIVLVEVENRPTLERFHDQMLMPQLAAIGAAPYPNNMVIDGNDSRGIDVGILSRHPIVRMRSHITDRTDGNTVFSRDCPEYYIDIGQGRELVILPNHFASKGSDRTGERRRVQSARVKEIYQTLRANHDQVIVAGDLNDHPQGSSLDALLQQTDLRDAMGLPQYSGFPGTFQRATAAEKIDYLLLSPALARRVTRVDVERRGYYAPTKWASFDNITKETKDRYQASDHHCLWAELDL